MNGSSSLRLIHWIVANWQRSWVIVRALGLCLSGLLICGCSRLPKSVVNNYLTVPDQSSVVSAKAQKLNERGKLAIAENDLDKAEKLFGEALKIDVNYGSAHNNLGQVYLARKQLYLAAWEFEFARNLMPDRPEVELNLGLVYETANRLRQAESHYQTVVESDPQNAQAIASLARIHVKLDEDPVRINDLLNQVVMSNVSPEWVCWARDLLATKYALVGGSTVAYPPSGQADRSDRFSSPQFGVEELPTPKIQSEAIVPPPTDTEEAADGEPLKILLAPPPDLSSNLLPSRRLPASALDDVPSVNWLSFPQMSSVQPASFTESPTQQPPTKRPSQ